MITLRNSILGTKEIIVAKSTAEDFDYWSEYLLRNNLMFGADELHWNPDEGAT